MQDTESNKEKSDRPQYHHGDLRAKLIDTVRMLVEKRGPNGFSISQASRAAGVSSGAPYKHFRDKSEIVRAVATEGMRRLTVQMQAAVKDDGSTASIIGVGQAYVDFARAEPGVFRLMFGLTDDHGEDAEMQQAGKASYGTVLAQVAAFLGEHPDDPNVQSCAYTLWTVVHGHAFLEIDKKTPPMRQGYPETAFLTSVIEKILGERPAIDQA